jgi:hypothetical protein
VRRIFYILPYLTRSNQHTRRSYSIFSAQLDSFAPLERTVSTGVVWHVKASMICLAHRYSNNGGTLLQQVESRRCSPQENRQRRPEQNPPQVAKKGQTILSLCARVDGDSQLLR